MLSHSIRLRIRYSECDAQGILFNARYGELADVAATELFRHGMGGYERLLEAGLDCRVAHYEIDWSGPVAFDEIIRITASIESLGNSSYSLRVEFAGDADGDVRAVAKLIYVMVALPESKKTPIPDWFRELAMQDSSSNQKELVL